MPVIYVADEHHRLHWLWQELGARGLQLCHVDFHCDMRGLLIDRAAQRAAVLDRRELEVVDQGNFLTHAVHDGVVTGIRWLHAPRAGRLYDHPTVAYVGDTRLRLRPPVGLDWRPLAYREEDLTGWAGPAAGEVLDLDWDALACTLYTPEESRALQEAFLATPFDHVPEVSTFIFSPCSSYLDAGPFEDFLARLARKLDAEVVRLSPLPAAHSTVSRTPGRRQRLRSRLLSPLKGPQQRLRRALKHRDAAADLAFPYPTPRRD